MFCIFIYIFDFIYCIFSYFIFEFVIYMLYIDRDFRIVWLIKINMTKSNSTTNCNAWVALNYVSIISPVLYIFSPSTVATNSLLYFIQDHEAINSCVCKWNAVVVLSLDYVAAFVSYQLSFFQHVIVLIYNSYVTVLCTGCTTEGLVLKFYPSHNLHEDLIN